MSKTIDITPSWEAITPYLVQTIAHSESAASRDLALSELLRIARFAEQL